MKKIFCIVTAVLMLSGCSAGTTVPEETTVITTQSETVTSASETASETVSEETTAAEPEETLDFSSAEALLDSMTAEQKVGQMILGRFPSEGAEDIAAKYSLGGFTLYAEDFRNDTPDSMQRKTAAIQEASQIPMFLATDEEGGTVVRVSKFPQYRLSPFTSQIVLARDGAEKVREENAEKAELLISLGINFNLAPVADVTENHSDYIYDRTFGKDAETTGEYVAAAVEALTEGGVGSCLKHFPGYGSNVDTHTGSAEDNRSMSSFENTDLVPFRAGIEAGAPAVMINHNVVKAFDEENPASLSESVHGYLRDELGFEGVILTDDLGMDAILNFAEGSGESPYVLAVNAGNDLICTSDIETTYNDILAAVNDGRIDEERLNESVLRILHMKEKLGIVNVG